MLIESGIIDGYGLVLRAGGGEDDSSAVFEGCDGLSRSCGGWK